jgi:Rhodopirellula transposase DDE domain
VNRHADEADDELRLSIDTKAVVKIGSFSREGTNRVLVEALDHDYRPDAVLVPLGIFLPASDRFFIYLVPSPATADAIVDAIDVFWRDNRADFPNIKRLVFDQDNGPENNSHRTQFMARMVSFADSAGIDVRLAYYPPYHSKYNPVERCWAALEKSWNGSLLDSVAAVVGHASNMTWNGVSPVVKLVEKVYEKGVSLTKAAWNAVEARLVRDETLGRWFVDIPHSVA